MSTEPRRTLASCWKLVMFNPGEIIARHFPLCKRGMEGDFQSLSTRKRWQSPRSPSPKGEARNATPYPGGLLEICDANSEHVHREPNPPL